MYDVSGYDEYITTCDIYDHVSAIDHTWACAIIHDQFDHAPLIGYIWSCTINHWSCMVMYHQFIINDQEKSSIMHDHAQSMIGQWPCMIMHNQSLLMHYHVLQTPSDRSRMQHVFWFGSRVGPGRAVYSVYNNDHKTEYDNTQYYYYIISTFLFNHGTSKYLDWNICMTHAQSIIDHAGRIMHNQ